MKTFLILFFGLCLLTSCGDDDGKDIQLKGEWEWISSTGGFAGVTLTPETEGYERALMFDNNKAEAFQDNLSVGASAYAIESRPVSSDPSSSSFCVMVFEERLFDFIGRELTLEEEGDDIVLFEGCADCFCHRFRKRL